MYSNRQLGWAGSSANFNYGQQAGTLHSHTPFWRSIFAYIVAIAVVSVGTIGVVNTLAAQQVAYQPATRPEPAVQKTVPAPAPPTTQPAVAAETPDPSAGLQAILNSWSKSHPSQQWSVVVQGLGTNVVSASLKPLASFRTASIYKLYLLYPPLVNIDNT